MSERPTPETDAEVIICHGIPDGFNPPERSYTSSKFARKLERERDEARDIGEKLSKQGLKMMDENQTLKRERDELLDILRKLLEIIPEPECHDFGHTKEERHAFLEECPVMARYDALIAQAKEAAK